MKVPAGLLDPQGLVAKGYVHLEANGSEVQEFGLRVAGKHSTCYVLVSPGDILTANLGLNSGTTGEFADLVVDGVLRNSWANSRGQKVFTYIFDRAIYAGPLIGGNRSSKATRFARMQVVKRNTSRDLPLTCKPPSPVGSMKIVVYRKEITNEPTPGDQKAEPSGGEAIQHGSGSGSGNGDASGATPDGIGGNDSGDAGGDDATTEGTDVNPTAPNIEVLQRDPHFVKYPTWQDLNRQIDSELVSPPFEMGFIDGRKRPKPRERVLKEYTGEYKLWASFTFLLRSTADLPITHFDEVPLHWSPSPPSTGPFGPTKVIAEGFTHSTTVDRPKQRSKSSDADVSTTASTASTDAVNGSKPISLKSKPEIKKPDETPEESIARKKGELVLKGVGSAPAAQAWAQRGTTEDAEDDDENVADVRVNPSFRKGMANILSSSIQEPSQTSTSKTYQLAVSQTQRLPTSISRARSPSSPSALVVPAHGRDERQPPPLILVSSAPARSYHNREVLTDNIPDISNPLQAPISQMLTRDTRDRAMQSHSRPSTPFNRQINTDTTPPGFSSLQISHINATQTLHNLPQRWPVVAAAASEFALSTPPSGGNMDCLVLGFARSPRPTVNGFSATTTPEKHHSGHPSSRSLRGPVSHHARLYSMSDSYSPAEELLSKNDVHIPKDTAIMTNYEADPFHRRLLSGMLETELGRTTTKYAPAVNLSFTTRPSTPDLSEIPFQPQPQEDSEMTGTIRPSNPLPIQQLGDAHFPETRPTDYDMEGATRSSLSVQPENQACAQNKHQMIFTNSRPASPAVSESPTETATEVAGSFAFEPRRHTSLKKISGNFPLSQSTIYTELQSQDSSSLTQASFNHTTERSIFGSFPRLPVAPDSSPLTHAVVQARLHWQNRTPTGEGLLHLADERLPGRVEDQDGNIELQSAPTLFVETRTNPVTRFVPFSRPAQTSLISPPPSNQKRKADSITGVDPTTANQSHKIPFLEQHVIERLDLKKKKSELILQNAEAEQYVKQSQGSFEDITRRYQAEKARSTVTQQQRRDNAPRWKEEIGRQNEVARARMAAAEHHKRELHARYDAALAIQKEWEKVNELNEEAEELERENAELQAKIAALYRGYAI